MKRSEEEMKKELQEQLNIQLLALEKEDKKLGQARIEFVEQVVKTEVSHQVISRVQGAIRDLAMARESISKVKKLME